MSEHIHESRYVEHVRCSRCGTRVSGLDPDLGLVVRAWVQCPECLQQPRCINCDERVDPHALRAFIRPGIYQPRVVRVGPFCAECYQVITRGLVTEGDNS